VPRVVGGRAGGRRLAAPPGRATRPTADRAREALASTLTALLGPAGLAGTRVLDLYAGSGAVGLELLSRGAAHVLLVERDRRAQATLRANMAAVGLDGVLERGDDVGDLARQPNLGSPFDVVFADPPYDLPAAQLADVLVALAANGWLATAALVVVERSARDAPWSWPSGFEAVQVRRYGEAALWYGRAAGEPPGST